MRNFMLSVAVVAACLCCASIASADNFYRGGYGGYGGGYRPSGGMIGRQSGGVLVGRANVGGPAYGYSIPTFAPYPGIAGGSYGNIGYPYYGNGYGNGYGYGGYGGGPNIIINNFNGY